MQTERVTFLATPDVKRAIAARASTRGLSLGEYVRRKAMDDDELSPEEEAELSTLVAEVNAAIPRMQSALEQARMNIAQLREESDRFFRDKGLAA